MSENNKDIGDESGINVPEDLIEIRDPDIDAEEIMAEIRDKIDRRRKELGYENIVFPSFGAVVYPGRPHDIAYDPDLYHHLKLVNKLYTDVETQPALEPSPALRIPLVGQLWQLIRQEAHNLVLYYVNRSINHDIAVHRHVISVLNLLTAENQKLQRSILALTEELEQLRSQLND